MKLPLAASTLVAAVPPPAAAPDSIGAAVGLPAPAESVDDLTPTNATKGTKSKSKKKSGANVDMDWGDEEESTHVFEKQRHGLPQPSSPKRPDGGRVDAKSAALLAASGASARPLPPPAPLPVPMPPPGAVPQKTTEMGLGALQGPRAAVEDFTPVRTAQPGSSSGRIALILGALALFAVVGLGVYILMPRTGQLKIDLKAKSGSSVAKAEIYVDGKKECETTPCVVTDLARGSKTVKVILPNGTATETSAVVDAGKENLVTVSIDDGATSPAPTASADVATSGTGLKATGQTGTKVIVDTKEAGMLPVTLSSLTPGDHTVKFDAGDDYEPLTKTVTVSQNQLTDLGEIKLKVLKGHLTLELKTSGAQVVLTSMQNGKAVEKKLKDDVWKSPPVKINIDAKDQWTIAATKTGYDEFKQEVKFDDGAADKTLTIELNETGKAPVTPPGPGPAVGTNVPPPLDTGKPKDTQPSGTGTLNINSIPVARVVLDGTPVGSTPIIGRTVSAGTHTVMFAFESGHKTVSVTVQPGKTATAAAKGN